MPPHIETLFAGRCLPLMDGADHRARKQFIMAAFTPEAVASYVPTIQRLVDAHLDRWSQAGEVDFAAAFERLAIEVICAAVFGLEPGPTVDRIAADYVHVGKGFSGLPIPLPGTAFTRAKAALERILAIYDENIAAHQQQPRDDGLSRILAAKDPQTGAGIAPEDLRKELHHLIVAGLIEWAWMVTTTVELARHPDLRARLAAEVAALPAALTRDAVEALPLLDHATREVRRLSPVVPVFFGKARADIDFAGHRIPAGWMVLWACRSSHLRPEVYAEPERFDPQRFAPGRAEHERHACAYAPNGAGPALGHKCAGYELAPLLLKVFVVQLLRRADYTLASTEQPQYDWKLIPPKPRGGVKARVQLRATNAN
jgi:cytochrome P450